MDFAVLVKVVPPLDDLRYDAKRRTVVREGTELFLNPFDQRALRVALELRKEGEKVSVLSVGPLGARSPLRDAVVLGADRTLLLSDPRLAGSDTLATARALRAALSLVGHDVILAGAWTTDSETGQVGPELAALLDIPLLTGARGMGRDVDGPGLIVTVDTRTGWASYAGAAPMLVTVGEKIIKPGKVAPEVRAGVPESRVEVVGLDGLSIDPVQVGLAGSPTQVDSVTEDAPARAPVVLAEGTPAERVARAVELLRKKLTASPPREDRWRQLPEVPGADQEVLVLVTGATGGLEPYAIPLLSEVRRSLPGFWPSAVWVGADALPEQRRRLARAGARAAYRVPLRSVPTDSRTVAAAFGEVLDLRPSAAAGMILSDPFGRETAGQLAAARSLGLTGDAIAVRYGTPDTVVWSKPSFGGRTVAGITSRTRPSLATVRPGVWGEGHADDAGTELPWTVLPALAEEHPLLPFDSGEEVAEGAPLLSEREVVIAVGMGLGGPGGLAVLEPLLVRWDAALGATRKVVDAGWVPRQFQIGLTGHAPAPRLGVLLGVGGAANHLVGWKRARALLAVNRDPSAPVFRDVDVGIVGTVEEIAPLLTEAIAPLIGR
ncbi:MAG: FAD-binding protein [Thermoplasmata archaeon]